MWNNRRFVLLALTLFTLVQVAAWAKNVGPRSETLPEVLLALPEHSRLKIRWVLPPDLALAQSARRKSSSAAGPRLSFSVDHAGNPWIGIDGLRLICPTKQFCAVLSEPWQSFVHLDNGAMLVATARQLGYLALDAQAKIATDGLPIVPFQPLVSLPGPNTRVFGGSDDTVYFVQDFKATGRSTLFCLRPGTRNTPPEYVKLLDTEEPITAVAGNGKTTLPAFGSLVTCLDKEYGPFFPWPVQPMSDIVQLVYKDKLGAFYVTKDSVGFLGGKRGFRLMSAANPQICLRGNSLYVFMPQNFGVLAIDHLDELR